MGTIVGRPQVSTSVSSALAGHARRRLHQALHLPAVATLHPIMGLSAFRPSSGLSEPRHRLCRGGLPPLFRVAEKTSRPKSCPLSVKMFEGITWPFPGRRLQVAFLWPSSCLHGDGAVSGMGRNFALGRNHVDCCGPHVDEDILCSPFSFTQRSRAAFPACLIVLPLFERRKRRLRKKKKGEKQGDVCFVNERTNTQKST